MKPVEGRNLSSREKNKYTHVNGVKEFITLSVAKFAPIISGLTDQNGQNKYGTSLPESLREVDLCQSGRGIKTGKATMGDFTILNNISGF